MSVEDKQKQIESAVLGEVLALHPANLTVYELVLKMAAENDPSEQELIRQAVRELRGAGLLRDAGDAVAPTYAAIRVATLLWT